MQPRPRRELRSARYSEVVGQLGYGERAAMLLPQLAGYFGVPVMTRYDLWWKGESLPGYRVGRHVRYRVENVEAWLEERADRRGGARRGVEKYERIRTAVGR